MNQSGLDADGYIVSEVSQDKILPEYRHVIDASVTALKATLPGAVHSVYTYGSVVRGNAVRGKSDLDLLVIFKRELTEQEREALRDLQESLSSKHKALVREVGIADATCTYDEMLDPKNKYGWGAYLKILCVCVDGEDLTQRFDDFKISPDIAIGFNGSVGDAVEGAIQKVSNAKNDTEIAKIASTTARKLIRTCYMMVMTRAQIWTTKLDEQADLFLRYFPEKQQLIDTLQAWLTSPTVNQDDVLKFLHSEAKWIVDNFEVEAKVGPWNETSDKGARIKEKPTMDETDWWQKMFDQKYLDTYLGGLTSDRTKAEVDFIVKAVQLKPPDNILDLACGHGRHSIELAKRGYAHITGIDYSEVFIAKAIEDAKQAGVTVRFQRGDMKELAFDNKFDVILLIYTAFGYFDDKTNKDVLRRIHKSLKSGGRFLMDVVSGETVIERFAQHGVLDPEMGLPKIARQVEMSGILTDEIEWFDVDRQILHSHREWQDKGQKKEYDFYLHVYTMPQFEVMFAETGFEIENTWGNYQGEAFGSEGTTGTLILAKKK